jgi:hypothetical protein
MMNNPVAKTGSKNFPLYRLFHYESNTLSRLIGTGYQFLVQLPDFAFKSIFKIQGASAVSFVFAARVIRLKQLQRQIRRPRLVFFQVFFPEFPRENPVSLLNNTIDVHSFKAMTPTHS